jgi:hypothetical protein
VPLFSVNYGDGSSYCTSLCEQENINMKMAVTFGIGKKDTGPDGLLIYSNAVM